ncbi:hypothetical protein Tco_1220812 [Tanacetum coccineum]
MTKAKTKSITEEYNNALIETNGEDEVEHIDNFLKIVDPLVLHNVSYERLRLVVFPISLTEEASKWLKEERQCLITTWGDLTMRLFGKYYLPSCTGKMTETKAKWDPTDVVFENWSASKFTNHSTMDLFTKNALWDYWKMGDDEIALTNGKVFDVEEEYSNEDGEIAEIFRIETNIFNYKTPILMKSIRMIGYMNGIKTYHRYLKNHERIMKYGKNPLLLNITMNHSRLRVDIQNGQLTAGKMTDISMEETYLDHLELFGKGGMTMRISHNNAEGNNDDADGIGNLDNDLSVDNASYHASAHVERRMH